MTTGLTGVRVLELAGGIAAAFAGRLLATYGADVVKVEPPKGDAARRYDLTGASDPDPEASALFLYLNAGKRSVTLDAGTAGGRAALASLVGQADVLIEDLGPDALARLGLDWPALHARHPQLTVVSMSPFGSFGPYAGYRATGLVSYAIGGQLYFTGNPDGPPMKTYGFQAEYQAGLHGFSVALLALVDRTRNGRAQRVELAAMELLASQQEEALPTATIHGVATRFRGGNMLSPLWGLYPASDGYVGLFALAPNYPAIAEALDFPELLTDPRFTMRSGEIEGGRDILEAVIRGWCLDHTRAEAYRHGEETGAPITMVLEVPELLRWPPLVEAGFWREVDHPVAGRVIYPGPAITLGEGEGIAARAPLLGEHAGAVAAEWAGASRALPVAPAAASRAPLEGIRILDFTIVWSGPYAAALLADMGAEVIKIEGPGAYDSVRPLTWIDEKIRALYSPYVCQYNRNKLGFGVDIKSEAGRDLVLQLVARSDVVIENFRAGVIERLGLSYEDLRRANPRIIMLSMPGFTSTGPEASRAAYGPVVEGMSGFVGLGGEEGGPPLFSGLSYSDPVAGTLAAGAMLLALLHRERTGRGQRVELSQRNAMINLLGEAIVEYSLGGRTPPRLGSRHPRWAPQGVYPCRPLNPDAAPLHYDLTTRLTDRWLALSVTNDDEWAGLCRAIAARGGPALAGDPRFATAARRQANHDALDDLIAGWTREQDVVEAFHLLQAAGVPAAPVNTAVDHLRDPHLLARGFFEDVDHPRFGWRSFSRPTWLLSETPQHLRTAAPLVGEHNNRVLREVLGLEDDAIAGLRASGVLYDGPAPP